MRARECLIGTVADAYFVKQRKLPAVLSEESLECVYRCQATKDIHQICHVFKVPRR